MGGEFAKLRTYLISDGKFDDISVKVHPPKPTVGRIVHYVSYGTPNGEFEPEHRAAIITGVIEDIESLTGVGSVHLCVLNPDGMFFNKHVRQDEEHKRGGTWHWPEME